MTGKGERMILKRLFLHSRGKSAGCGFPWIAMLALFLCACGDGAISVPAAPLVPVVPVEPSPPLPAAANSVFVANPADGEILALVGQPRVFAFEFRASQGSASGLTLSLPSMPGWRAASEALHCAAVDTAGACRLQAIYTPTAPAASASMRFSYAYTDNAGAAREGTYSVAYRVLAANTVVASQRPGGVLRGIVGRAAPVTLEFDTSDGEPATSLKVTSDLAALPAGWNSDQAEFTCAQVGRGQLCRLALSYSPALPAGDSALDLAYSYLDSSGASRSGTARVDYSAILAGSVSASLDASGPLLAKPGEYKEITVRFRTSDGVGASALRLDADPASTPGWSVLRGWQGCATIDGSDSCSLTLVFAPSMVLGPATLPLTYRYIDNTGEARSGSIDIGYSSRVYEAYIADYRDDGPGGVRLCTIAAEGGLSNCAAADVDLPAKGRGISHVLASGRQAYVSSLAAGDSSSVFLCAIAADGTLKDCRQTGAIRAGVSRLLLRGAVAYILTGDGKILRQDVDVASGEIRPCAVNRGNCEMANVGRPVTALGFAGARAYIARPGVIPSYMEAKQCGINVGGDLDCTGPAFLSTYHFTAGTLAAFEGPGVSRIYIVGEPYFTLMNGEYAVIKCDVFANAPVGGCDTGNVATIDYSGGVDALSFRDLTFDGMHAYIVQQARIFLCDVSAGDGRLPNCRALGPTGATRQFALSINRIN
jgi:hypothetical protein